MKKLFKIFLVLNIFVGIQLWNMYAVVPPPATNNPIATIQITHQMEVNFHLKERSQWECKDCTQCVPEYIPVPNPPVSFRVSKDDPACPVQCNLNGVQIETTMENQGCWKGTSQKVCGNTRRNSDVHMQYYSWESVDFMRFYPPPAKSIFLSSFISNCNGGDRLQWMADLQKALAERGEHRVHNYGACNRDTFLNDDSNRASSKDKIAQQSYFVFSFENSQTEDYVTEKLFDMLSSSTIPVYRGATNARVYAPSRRSVVFANEYSSAAHLADALINISRNDYSSYFEWKQTGPDLKWITLIDEGIVHSLCRTCILLARPFLLNAYRWYVRERGSYEFIGFSDTNSLEDFQGKISIEFRDNSTKPEGSGAVVQLYEAWDRNHCNIDSIEALQRLPYASQLEVVLENPGWTKRAHFVEWWKLNRRPTGYSKRVKEVFQAPPQLQ